MFGRIPVITMRITNAWKLIVALFIFPSSSFADEVKIYIWEEFLSEEVVQRFEQQTGHSVKQVYFENEILRDEVITNDRAEAFDLVMVDGLGLNLFGSKGLMYDLSQKPFTNKKFIDNSAIEACGPYGIPYAWGTMGIAYRTSKIGHPIVSWKQVFSASSSMTDKIMIPYDDIDTIAAALLAKEHDPFTSDVTALTEAFELLKEVAPKVKDFRNAVAYTIENKQESDLELAVVYSGEVNTIIEETQQKDWVYIVPEEGTVLWYECFSTLAAKPPSAATIEFLNFINDPVISAENAEEFQFSTTNKEALKYASKEYLNDKNVFPGTDVLTHSFPYRVIDVKGLKIRSRILNAIEK